MDEWALLADRHPGWGLGEVKDLTPRERVNWLTLARMKREG